MFGKLSFYIKDFDWFIFLLALSIAVIGVVEIHSATQYNTGDRFYVRQIYWIILGLIMMVIAMSIDYHTLVENVPASRYFRPAPRHFCLKHGLPQQFDWTQSRGCGYDRHHASLRVD